MMTFDLERLESSSPLGWVFRFKKAGKPLLTPKGKPLCAPTKSLADKIVIEWSKLTKAPKLGDIPLTAYLNTALDILPETRAEVERTCLSYLDTDLLCYFTQENSELLAEQKLTWQPWLSWFEQKYHAPLVSRISFLAQKQPEAAYQAVQVELANFSDLKLLALRELTALLGSIVLGLAVVSGQLEAQAAYQLSLLEEAHQQARWGRIEEHDEAEQDKKRELVILAELLKSMASEA